MEQEPGPQSSEPTGLESGAVLPDIFHASDETVQAAHNQIVAQNNEPDQPQLPDRRPQPEVTEILFDPEVYESYRKRAQELYGDKWKNHLKIMSDGSFRLLANPK